FPTLCRHQLHFHIPLQYQWHDNRLQVLSSLQQLPLHPVPAIHRIQVAASGDRCLMLCISSDRFLSFILITILPHGRTGFEIDYYIPFSQIWCFDLPSFPRLMACFISSISSVLRSDSMRFTCLGLRLPLLLCAINYITLYNHTFINKKRYDYNQFHTFYNVRKERQIIIMTSCRSSTIAPYSRILNILIT